MPEGLEVVPQLEELSPEQKDISVIVTSDNPLRELRNYCKVVRGHRVDYNEIVALKTQTMSLNSSESLKARNTLTWYCLPTLNRVLHRWSGLGLDDRQLFERGLDLVHEAIVSWEPVANPRQQDYLHRRIFALEKCRFPSVIADFYGLGVNELPLIRLYFKARDLFRKKCQREARQEDFEELKQIAQEKEPNILKYHGLKPPENEELGRKMLSKRHNKRLKEKDPWSGDDFRRIHDISITDSMIQILQDEKDSGDPEAAANLKMLKEDLRRQIDTLSVRYRRVLDLRFGLTTGEPMTLEQVANHFKVSSERIGQIEARAFRRLRHPIRSKYLRDYI